MELIKILLLISKRQISKIQSLFYQLYSYRNNGTEHTHK